MAKDKIILIEFDEEIDGIENNKQAFTVSGKAYKYVNGPLIDIVYPVLDTRRPAPPISSIEITEETFNEGISNNLAFKNGSIVLGVVY